LVLQIGGDEAVRSKTDRKTDKRHEGILCRGPKYRWTRRKSVAMGCEKRTVLREKKSEKKPPIRRDAGLHCKTGI